MTALVILQSAILLVLCILVAGLLRSYATVLQRLHVLDGGTTSGPPFRTAAGVVSPPADPTQPSFSGLRSKKTASAEWGPAYDITGTGLRGEIMAIRVAGTGLDTVLVFLSSGCAGCTGFWQDLAQRRELSLVPGGRVLVVTKDPEAESIGTLGEICPVGVDLVMSSQAWQDYDVPGSPYVVVVDGASGRVSGQGSGTSLTQLSGLLHQALGDLVGTGVHGPPAKPRADADREVDVDRVLLAAGLSPGDASLYAPVEMAEGTSPELIGYPGVGSERN